jgi:hypothetical protein
MCDSVWREVQLKLRCKHFKHFKYYEAVIVCSSLGEISSSRRHL